VGFTGNLMGYTLSLFNIVMASCPFVDDLIICDDLPINNDDFP